jgi:mono/diheme cytochrome c family protein
MKALNCVHCHSGGGENKLPDITLAGEKLDREWLQHLLAGKQPVRTRPWLEARMPAFASRAEHLAAGLAAKHGMPLKTTTPAPNVELVPIGEKLAGAEGYSCIACHDAGSRKALQVFEGQGPNLAHAPERLRYDYFQRWMHWPQRVAPATIMPRYTKDRDHAVLDTHFGGDAEKQFEALWNWMAGLNSSSISR